MARAEIGVFGGSGFYSFLEDVEEVEVETPYGKPSAPFTIGEVGGRRVAFLPRHAQPRAPAARHPLSRESLGDEGARGAQDHGPERLRRAQGRASSWVSSSSDQFVDRTEGARTPSTTAPRRRTYPPPTLLSRRALLVETAFELGIKARDGGTVVVIQGPGSPLERSRSGSRTQATINMTAYPEGYLARELELCYANISMVTDHDVGVEGDRPSRTSRWSPSSTRTTSACASSSSRSSRKSRRSTRSTSARRRYARALLGGDGPWGRDKTPRGRFRAWPRGRAATGPARRPVSLQP